MKKGFTLVELLAVLIIIGLLSVLIVPKVLKTLNDSEQKTNLASAKELIKTAEYKYEENGINGISETIRIDYTNDINTDKIEFDGKKPEKGKLIVTKDGKIAFYIKIGDTCYIKNRLSQEIISKAYDSGTCKTALSFEDDSWTDIKNYLNENRKIYDIGSEKEIEIDGISYKVRLSNTKSCPDDWEGSKTACGVVIEFVNLLSESRQMNTTNTNVGGWPASDLYKYLNTNSDSIYNKLPQELKNAIIETKTISGYGQNSGTENYISTDKLYLLSYFELHGTDNNHQDTVTDTYTKQLEYYINKPSAQIVKRKPNATNCGQTVMTGGCEIPWWLRSAFYSIDNEFIIENDFEYVSGFDMPFAAYGDANILYGVAPAFRILD